MAWLATALPASLACSRLANRSSSRVLRMPRRRRKRAPLGASMASPAAPPVAAVFPDQPQRVDLKVRMMLG